MTDLETILRSTLSDAADAVTPSPDAWAGVQRRSALPRRQRMTVGLSVAGAALATAAIASSIVVWAGGTTNKPPVKQSDSRHLSLFPSPRLTERQLAKAAAVLRNRLLSTGVTGVQITVDHSALSAVGLAAGIAALQATATVSGSFQVRRVLAIGPGRGALPHQHPSAIGKAPTLRSTLLNKFRHWNCPGRLWPTLGRPRTAPDYIVGCSTDGRIRYLLGPAVLANPGVTSARPVMSNGTWRVGLTFTGPGSVAWRAVTAAAAAGSDPNPQDRVCAPSTSCNAVALVLDGAVIAAPVFTKPPTTTKAFDFGNGFTQPRAAGLASLLGSGRLPARFSQPIP